MIEVEDARGATDQKPRAEYDIRQSELNRFNNGRYLRGVILEIGILNNYNIARGPRKTRFYRLGFAAVYGLPKKRHIGALRGKFRRNLKCIIRRAIINNNDFRYARKR